MTSTEIILDPPRPTGRPGVGAEPVMLEAARVAGQVSRTGPVQRALTLVQVLDLASRTTDLLRRDPWYPREAVGGTALTRPTRGVRP